MEERKGEEVGRERRWGRSERERKGRIRRWRREMGGRRKKERDKKKGKAVKIAQAAVTLD